MLAETVEDAFDDGGGPQGLGGRGRCGGHRAERHSRRRAKRAPGPGIPPGARPQEPPRGGPARGRAPRAGRRGPARGAAGHTGRRRRRGRRGAHAGGAARRRGRVLRRRARIRLRARLDADVRATRRRRPDGAVPARSGASIGVDVVRRRRDGLRAGALPVGAGSRPDGVHLGPAASLSRALGLRVLAARLAGLHDRRSVLRARLHPPAGTRSPPTARRSAGRSSTTTAGWVAGRRI